MGATDTTGRPFTGPNGGISPNSIGRTIGRAGRLPIHLGYRILEQKFGTYVPLFGPRRRQTGKAKALGQTSMRRKERQ